MKLKLYIPENLDLNLFAGFTKAWLFKFLFVISSIYFKRVTNKKYTKEDFIPLRQVTLGKFILEKNVKKVRDTLIDLGIIECDFTYCIGKKAMGYRLTPEYRESKVRAITTNREISTTSIRASKENHRHILNSLERVTIAPGTDEALQGLCSASIDAFNSGLISRDWIQEKRWFFAEDEKTGRVFHNVANFKKELRAYLRFNGEPMVEVDIANCQPLLLFNFYPDKKSAEAIRYRELVENGRFYELLQSLLNQPDREKVKTPFITFLFAKSHWIIPVGEAFKKEFPELAKVIATEKREEHNALAIALQKLEADLVINQVVGICKKENIPTVTIHDSLLTLPAHVERVKRILEEECQRLYSISATVKTKELTEPLQTEYETFTQSELELAA